MGKLIRSTMLVLLVLLLTGCIHVQMDYPNTEQNGEKTMKIKTFGAGTASVATDGTVTTSSPGLSEGVTGVLQYSVQVAAGILRFMLPFPTSPAPEPEGEVLEAGSEIGKLTELTEQLVVELRLRNRRYDELLEGKR